MSFPDRFVCVNGKHSLYLKQALLDNLLTGSAVNPSVFKSLYPIHVFDVSKQSERLTEGVVNFTVRMELSANVRANTQAYAHVISDRMLKFKIDGSKMSALF